MSARFPRRLSPLCAALAAAMPLLCLGDLQAATPAPAPAQVPVPAVTWRVNGTGSAAPVNVVNNKGGVDQTIKQTSQRAIYQWQSFDIGASSSVTFDMAKTGASALNRVVGSTAPSQIFGKLKATNQGEIYLINANGILFGKGAEVNTGSLIASTLNISDTEFNSGLVNHLVYNPTSPAFAYEGSPEDFIDAKNFVRVEQGAALTTDGQGGRVFLFAKRVENAGSISTPGGQTVLAAGGSVYLQNPASNKLYASEANAEVPTLRGLLVEVGNGPGSSPEGGRGSVANLATGTIDTARGNTTLVGMAVNQSGIVRATTSVTENGSIILRAQGRAQPNNVNASATASGDLVLGAGSLTTITADTERNADGTVKTSDGNATYVNPRIDLAGKTVLLDKGAQVIAPGASVYVRAEVTPSYDPRNAVNYMDGNSDARVVMAEGSVIDVAGTTDTEVDVSRYFVTTELLGSNDLKDAPLQKDGLLFRSQATLDVRDDSKILGSLQSYRNTLQQSISERLSAGGKVSLSAEGAVLTHASSRIDVSGGRVKVAGAEVRATSLMASDGTLYDLNNAPVDLVYNQAINLQRGAAATYDRWGSQVSYGTVSSTRTEAGYVEGRAAGSLTVVAPIAALDGKLAAHVEAGDRQTRGLDTRASGGALTIGAVQQGTQDFNSSTYAVGPVLQSFNVSSDGVPADKLDQVWADPLNVKLAVDLSLASGMRRSLLTDSGFSKVAIAAEGNVRLSAQTAEAAFALADQGSLRLLSEKGSVTLGGQTTIHGGSVELVSKVGAVTLVDGAGVNLSGKFYNQALDGALDTAAATGGTFSAKAATALTLGKGSLVTVSGGAVVSEAGKLTGANAGSISLNHSAIVPGTEPGLVMQGRLEGYSLATGGSLSLAAPQVLIGAPRGDEPSGTQQLDASLFTQGGFSSYSVDGRLNLDVAAGTTVAPRRDAWTVDARPAVLQASGGSLAFDTSTGTVAVLSADGLSATQIGRKGLDVGEFAKPVNLTLSASGVSGQPLGGLTVGEGAILQMVDQSSLSLKAANHLLMLGDATSHGGKISLAISNQLTSPLTDTTWLWVGENSQIDVSGTAQLVTGTNGLITGKVLDGGSITLSTAGAEEAAAATLVLQRGASLIAHGTAAELDQTLLTATGKTITRASQASNGGSVAILSNGNLLLEGGIDLHAGGVASTGAKGGSLSVTLAPGRDEARTGSQRNLPRQLTLSTNRTDVTSGVDVSDSDALAQALQAATAKANVSTRLVTESGAADLTLAATESIRLFDNPNLNLAGTLTLNTQALVMPTSAVSQDASAPAAPAVARLEAAQVVLTAPRARSSTPPITQPEPSEGDAALTLVSRGGMTLAGQWTTSGLGELKLQAAGDLMLQGSTGLTTGGLDTRADVTLSARQISVASATDFVINAPDRALVIAGGDRSAEKPLSAGASLTVRAATIEQGGVLRLPQGQIKLEASEQLSLTAGSETSVSARGLTLPYGTTSNGRWTAPDGSILTAAPTKRIDLAAPALNVADGAAVDLSAGGDLKGYEFVAGKGGSSDVFAGGDGAYALLPGVHTAASYDTSIAGAAAQGRLIEIGSGGPLPAGVYTLLPARYAATQAGAFLVKPATGTAAYALGTAVAQADGSTLIGARLVTEGSDAYSQPGTWRITPQTVALKSSEIRSTSANSEFASRASVAGVARPELLNDAGTLSVAASTAALDGEFDFAVLRDQAGAALGRGGRAEFAADRIQVVQQATAQEGVLSLTASQLNQLGADSVLLGATSGASTDGVTALNVAASQVVFAQGANALTVPDLLAVSSDQLQVQAGARFAPAAATSGVAPTAYAVVGDGAALRVSSLAGASLTRSEVAGAAGGLQVAAGAGFNTAGTGSVVLDSSGTTRLDPSVQLSAADVVLASKVISVGGVSNDLQLAVTPALADSVAGASALTLRAYTHIDFKEGTTLGSESLDRLVLDTPRLRAVEATGPQGAQVVAGEITLTSTSANVSGAVAGAGQLNLRATDAAGGTGLIRLADGQMVVNGAAALNLSADRGVMFSGEQRLGTAGDLTVTAPLLAAAEKASASTLVAAGELVLNTNGRPNEGLPVAAQGASLSLQGRDVLISNRIVLPSGQVSVEADNDVRLGASGRINVAGQRVLLDGEAVDLGGGQVTLQGRTGDVLLDAGSLVNVSATGAAAAGQVRLQAAEGSVLVSGQLQGSSESGRGAS
ncbi:filamentous hemagglutinin N-terminal domain-containing protein, partial [Ideonella sp.]|uniref:two-partner secretion domain-containing protein n=1 Tax=Ideonella sp. TaxID=1929293 RepID=UPI003BB4E127